VVRVRVAGADARVAVSLPLALQLGCYCLLHDGDLRTICSDPHGVGGLQSAQQAVEWLRMSHAMAPLLAGSVADGLQRRRWAAVPALAANNAGSLRLACESITLKDERGRLCCSGEPSP
jgi:hypothetical protein